MHIASKGFSNYPIILYKSVTLFVSTNTTWNFSSVEAKSEDRIAADK